MLETAIARNRVFSYSIISIAIVQRRMDPSEKPNPDPEIGRQRHFNSPPQTLPSNVISIRKYGATRIALNQNDIGPTGTPFKPILVCSSANDLNPLQYCLLSGSLDATPCVTRRPNPVTMVNCAAVTKQKHSRPKGNQ